MTLEHPSVPLRAHRPDAPELLDRILRRALEKQPERPLALGRGDGRGPGAVGRRPARRPLGAGGRPRRPGAGRPAEAGEGSPAPPSAAMMRRSSRVGAEAGRCKASSTVVIVGVGLIGGSIGRALRERGLAGRVVGVGRDPGRLDEAEVLGAIDAGTTDLGAACRSAVRGRRLHAGRAGSAATWSTAAGSAGPDCLVTDAGSTKARIVAAAEADPAARCAVRRGAPAGRLRAVGRRRLASRPARRLQLRPDPDRPDAGRPARTRRGVLAVARLPDPATRPGRPRRRAGPDEPLAARRRLGPGIDRARRSCSGWPPAPIATGPGSPPPTPHSGRASSARTGGRSSARSTTLPASSTGSAGRSRPRTGMSSSGSGSAAGRPGGGSIRRGRRDGAGRRGGLAGARGPC